MNTTTATIRRGEPVRSGTRAPYRALEPGPGEPHVRRDELAQGTTPAAEDAQVLLRFVHLTDFQLADLASPGRLEFLQQMRGAPDWERDWAAMLPSYRPQEPLNVAAIDAMIATVRHAATDGRVDFVITTGDNTDSAQRNELDTFLALLEGGRVDPTFGTGSLDDIPSALPGGAYWNPEPGGVDVWKAELGFPEHAGLLAVAAEPFDAAGVGLPWLACFGNHDCLVQGRAPTTPTFEELVTGRVKPVALPPAMPDGPAIERYRFDPTALSGGRSSAVAPSPSRRSVDRAEYIAAHLEAPGTPYGHGFTRANLARHSAYYVYDATPGIRVIVLDTTNPGGYADGSIGDRQFSWLAEQLAEAHSIHMGTDGRTIRTGNTDRLILLFSHHGLSTLGNGAMPPPDRDVDADPPRHLADEVRALLHRFPNVVAWVSGHTHINRVTPRPAPSGALGAGFWEISTSSVCEWPVQARLVEVGLTGGDTALLRCTCLDSAAPVASGAAAGRIALARLHRELAANEPGGVGGPMAHGKPTDRNVELAVALPDALAARLRR